MRECTWIDPWPPPQYSALPYTVSIGTSEQPVLQCQGSGEAAAKPPAIITDPPAFQGIEGKGPNQGFRVLIRLGSPSDASAYESSSQRHLINSGKMLATRMQQRTLQQQRQFSKVHSVGRIRASCAAPRPIASKSRNSIELSAAFKGQLLGIRALSSSQPSRRSASISCRAAASDSAGKCQALSDYDQ